MSASVNVIPLLSAYSAMAVIYQGSSSTSNATATSTISSYNVTESFSTVYVSSTTYKVNINYNAQGEALTYSAWILKSGAIVGLYASVNGQGFNYTGSESQDFAVGIFAGFILQIDADNAQSTYSSYAHSTGTSTVTIGTQKLTVTNYSATNLPITEPECNGQTSTITALSFSVGTPSGASAPLATNFHYAGSTNLGNGQTDTISETMQVTSFTLV